MKFPLSPALCLLAVLTSNHVSATRGCGEDTRKFASPPSKSRPFFRYWLPDASVEASVVEADIARAASVGAGGVEFIPFYQYGGDAGSYPPGAAWAKYGFGTEPFVNLFRRALKAHQSHGLTMDFALGPNQGQGVPAQADDEGLQWDLVPYSQQVPANGSLEGMIVGWGTGKLVSLVIADVRSRQVKQWGTSTVFGVGYNYTSFVLRENSLSERSNKVSQDGQIDLQLGPASGTAERWAFVFYQKRSLRRNLKFPNTATQTIFDNGSYTVDHFNPRGALTTIKFWEKHILKNGLDETLRQVGGNGWEDSPEILSTINWSDDLPARFRRQHGYDILKYLPLVMFSNNNVAIQGANPGRLQAVLDSPHEDRSVQNDYRATLELGHREYLTTMSEWLNRRLGLSFRAQVSYNLPMDMATNIPFVDVPECESLGFFDSRDAYLQYTGPAILAGKPVISNEVGAVILSAYSYTFLRLLYSTNMAFASGVNKFYIHGQSYTGNYYQTTWPGYTPFQYVFSEIYSPKQPSWNNGFREVMDYLARTQLVLQTGVARLDVAIYNKVSVTNTSFPKVYTPDDLIKTGYTYGYLTPVNFKLKESYVRDKLLAPATSCFKALVLPDKSLITLEAVQDLIKFAESGLPILVVGHPVYYESHVGTKAKTWAAYDKLRSLPSVYSGVTSGVAETLESIGLEPTAKIQTDSVWYHAVCHDSKSGLDIVFIFSNGNASQGFVEVSTTGIPYIFNGWTGARKPVMNYKRDFKRGRVTISLRLAAHEAKILVFSQKPLQGTETPENYFTNLPASVLGTDYTKAFGYVLRVARSASPSKGTLSVGSSITIQSASVPPAFELQEWDLTVEHWEAPGDMSDATVVASKRNTTHHLKAPLASWTTLGNQLTNTSGVGYYVSSFIWPPAASVGNPPHGAYISFSQVSHTIKLWINGKRVPPLDLNKPVADIGSFLKIGENDVLVIVPSTMWNYLRSILPSIRNAGDAPLKVEPLSLDFPLPPLSTENGLIGTVTLTPYMQVLVRD